MNAFDDMGRPRDGGIRDIIPLVRKDQGHEDECPVLGMTTVEEYRPYQHVRALLRDRYAAVPKNPRGIPADINQWMDMMGRKNKAKLIRRLSQWMSLRKDIPHIFLEILGISRDELRDALEHDRQAYHEALKRATRPTYLQTRYGPCIYPVFPIPDSVTNEEEAIAYTRDFIIRYGRQDACLQYRAIKTVWVTREGYHTEYYEPRMIATKDSVLFILPQMHGTVSL